jgi:putative intracellular protease/amidase
MNDYMVTCKNKSQGGLKMKQVYLIFVLVFVLVFTGYVSAQEKGNKVLIVLREMGLFEDKEFFQTKEAIETACLLEEAGFQPVLASASGKTFIESSSSKSYETLKLAKVKVSDYEAFIFPSDNRKSLYTQKDNATPEEISIVRQAVAEGKFVTAQRWGIVVLAEAGVLEDVQFSFTVNPREDERFGNADDNWNNREVVVQDKNILTTSLCPFADPGIELTNELIAAFEE